VGLIVEVDSASPGGQRVYMQRPPRDDVWSIGIYSGTSPFALAPVAANPVLTPEHVSDVPAVFVADPFLVRADGCWHMFFEVMNWRSGKGEIGLATSADGIHWSYRRIVLAEPFHLSYPYVFEWGKEYYLVPESHQAGAVRLYRARKFPGDWVYAGTLLTGSYLADASLLHHGGRWWLFVDTSPAMNNDTLCLFFAECLDGPWREHPASPVIAGDPHLARPAGRMLVTGGRVFRFAQDCEPHYGLSVRAFEVTRLSETHYEERPVTAQPILGPDGSGWNAGGMHHIDVQPLDDGLWLAAVDGWSPAAEI